MREQGGCIRAGSLTRYRYDKNGSIISEEEEGRRSEYHYDLLNRQTYVRTLDGKEQENFYDGEGLRAGITENEKKTTFLYYNGEILAESDGESAPTRRYLRGIGLSHVQTQDGTCHAFHQDEQGSTAYITGQGSETENVYQYDAFGNLTEKKEGITNRIRYTGQQYDQETGQYYLKARYYNPVVGRFMQADTYRGDGLNLYAYCADNPVVYYDPSGNLTVIYNEKGEPIETPPAGQVGNKGGGETKLDYVTSNGLVLEATPNKTTTVLGTYKSDTGAILDELGNVKSLDFGPRDGGFNLLNTPDELYVSPNQFWNEYNKPWLDNAIARGDIFKIATEPTWDNLTRVNMFTGKTELTGFGREYTYLLKHGYTFDNITKTMFK